MIRLWKCISSPEKVSPYGKVSVELKSGDQEQFNTTDVQKLSDFLEEKGVKPKVGDVPGDNTFMSSILPLILVGIMVIFVFNLMSRQMSGGSNAKMMNFGKRPGEDDQRRGQPY
mgnify:CR=1 FL=1